jgi:hypothetical protein
MNITYLVVDREEHVLGASRSYRRAVDTLESQRNQGLECELLREVAAGHLSLYTTVAGFNDPVPSLPQAA